MVQYTAVAACTGRAILDVLQYPLKYEFADFQPSPLYALYTLAFFTMLELVPLVVLVYVIEVQTTTSSACNTQIQSTLDEDVFLASYTAVPLEPQRYVDPI